MSRQPRFSILLPNLNHRKHLPQRLESIFQQTVQDWELIVVDSFSDDGAWEFIQEKAEDEPRMRISQAPRGLYASWNRCLQKARGEFVYIATSDDTMSPDCLEKMSAALDRHPDCDLCHCCLTVIDGEGNPVDAGWEEWEKNRFFGELLFEEHVRRAPHDGLLHCVFGSMYTSITELLIRRRVFDDAVGGFKTQFGSVADFEWGLRAGLTCNVVHIPEFLATWRRHADQATHDADWMSPEGWRRTRAMIESAVRDVNQSAACIVCPLDVNELTLPARYFELTSAISRGSGRLHKLREFATAVFRQPREAKRYLFNRLGGRVFSRVDYGVELLTKYGCTDAVRQPRMIDSAGAGC